MFRYHARGFSHPHSLYLGKIVELGLIGGGVFLFLLLCLLGKSLTALRKEMPEEGRIFLVASLAAISGFLVKELIDYTYIFCYINLFFWFLAAILIKVSVWRTSPKDVEAKGD